MKRWIGVRMKTFNANIFFFVSMDIQAEDLEEAQQIADDMDITDCYLEAVNAQNSLVEEET